MSSPLVAAAAAFAGRTALVDPAGRHTYDDLLAAADRVAAALLERAGGDRGGDLDGAPIATWIPPGAGWVAATWGIWQAGGVAVPLALAYPPPELEQALATSGAGTLVVADEMADAVAHVRGEHRVRHLGSLLASRPPADGARGAVASEPGRAALLLFTSGTTGRPKAATITHANLATQVRILHRAWGWRRDDAILSVLPLHHTHGIVNVVCCALAAGARCEILPRFDAEAVWEALARETDPLTLFMAVPTIYSRLVAAWDAAPDDVRARWSAGAARLRLAVSGSAALPPDLFARWEEIAGQRLLERYGMTEIGMALANPLDGERRPGTVGRPLPDVEVRLVDPEGAEVGDGEAGELEVRGPSVFAGYWRDPAATAAAFRPGDEPPWFRTGDVAVREEGVYRLLGRQSVDILKSGGEKVSALEVEAALRLHPAVADCAVVGLADAEWGQRIVAAVVLRPAAETTAAALREFARRHLAAFKVPKEVALVAELPRNPLGKVVKPELARRLSEPSR